MRQRDDTDLTSDQWKLIEPHLPAGKAGGRPRTTDLREVLNAIFYRMRAGCAWRLLPHDFPPASTVYGYLRAGENDGTWETLNRVLREQVRERAGRNRQPSAGSIDSQSVKTAGASQEVGSDGGKKVKGRKRTILVDTMGLLLGVSIHSAARSDHKELMLLGIWCAATWCSLQKIWTDSTFGGRAFTAWVEKTFGWTLEVVKRPPNPKGFQVLPRRWVVERTFAWFGRLRRLSKEYSSFRSGE